MKVEVTKGEIILDFIDLIIDDPSAKVVLINMTTKRCEAMTIWGDGECLVELTKVEGSMYIDEQLIGTPTTIAISDLPAGHWQIAAESGRYSVFVFLYEMGPERRIKQVLYYDGKEESE